jgi:hypothetical protein
MIKAGMIQKMEIILLSRMTILMNVYCFCRPCIANERINITWSPSLFLMGPKIVYLYVLLTTLYLCLGISGVCLWIKYDNIVFCCLTIFRCSFTYLFDFKNDSREIRPNDLRLHFCHKQAPISRPLNLVRNMNKTCTKD